MSDDVRYLDGISDQDEWDEAALDRVWDRIGRENAAERAARAAAARPPRTRKRRPGPPAPGVLILPEPATHERLLRAARAAGVDPSTYVRDLLARHLADDATR
jgi:hypothetical protein